MVEEQLNTGSKNRPKNLNSSLRSEIEKLSSKNDLMNDSIHQGLIN